MARRKNGAPGANGTTTAPPPEQGKREPPLKEIRLGKIKAVVWKNRTDDGQEWLSIAVCRIYKSGDEWKAAHSFGPQDALVAAEALRQAALFVMTAAKETPAPAAESNGQSGIPE